MPTVEFWFEFASTYSYLSAMTVEARCREAGVDLVYRPFLLGPIFAAQGWDDSPFNLYEAKGRYMWLDVQRCAAEEGLAFRRPSVFPRSGLRAARITLAMQRAAPSVVPAFVRAVYRANFVDDRATDTIDTLLPLLETATGDRREVILAAANSPEIKGALRAQTEEAAALGMFGAPTFRVGDELFWGHDRLTMALRAAIR